MKKPKVLCICAVGLNRSKYLAKYLGNKGYRTRYGGVEDRTDLIPNHFSQEDVDWADIIIITRARLEKLFKKKFKAGNKKIIVLDVTDSKKLIPGNLVHLRKLSHEEFQKKWTRPKLRKAIKPYLPLELK